MTGLRSGGIFLSVSFHIMILVTGGAGFIGGNFVLDGVAQSDVPVVNLENHPAHIFTQGDSGDAVWVVQLLATHRPRAVVNFAAESHMDRSIHGSEDLIQTNVLGNFRLFGH